MTKLPKLRFSDPAEIRDFRRKNSMNQLEFWARIGVTQSGGSRYESGRNIPKPVQLLLTLIYGTDGQSKKLTTVLRDWKHTPKS